MRAHEIIFEQDSRREFLQRMMGLGGALAAGNALAGVPPLPSKKKIRQNEKKYAEFVKLQRFDPKDNIDLLITTCYNYGITSITDLANILGNCEIETVHWKTPVEYTNYDSEERLQAVFTSRWRDTGRSPKHYVNNPVELADFVYGDRGDLGNRGYKSGDGWRYRGRGFIHLTGRDAYVASNYDKNPDILIVDPKEAAKSTAWYYKTYKNLIGSSAEKAAATISRINRAERLTSTANWLKRLETNKTYNDLKNASKNIKRTTTNAVVNKPATQK